MNACMERSKQRMFVKSLFNDVSADLAAWVDAEFNEGWDLTEVKRAINAAAKVAGKD